MATEKQVAALRDFKLAVSDSVDRRGQWQNLVPEVMKLLKARVTELKDETGVGLEMRSHGKHDEQTVQVDFPLQRAWVGTEESDMEHGAALMINCRMNGLVQFIFVPAYLHKGQHPQAKILGTEDPHKVTAKLDDYLEQFLRLAADTHWSHVNGGGR